MAHLIPFTRFVRVAIDGARVAIVAVPSLALSLALSLAQISDMVAGTEMTIKAVATPPIVVSVSVSASAHHEQMRKAKTCLPIPSKIPTFHGVHVSNFAWRQA